MRKALSEPTLEWFKDYCIRDGGDGKPGIYLREYNVRLATFNANTAALQTRLKLLFDRAIAKPKPKKRKPREKMGEFDAAWGPGSGNW